MPDLSRMWKLRKQTTHILDKGSELALNIRQLALKWMTEKTRPVAFCREQNASGLTRTSPQEEQEEEKTGQSVDFVARNGADLCESEPDL